jgi:hypothetical protein
MPRQNFVSVPLSDSVSEIFDQFVKAKEVTKTSALTDMVELYMLATDEDLYLELKKKLLGVEKVRPSILSRTPIVPETTLCDTYLFMRLGTAMTRVGPQDGNETMRLYQADELTRGYTWFSTSSLFFGLAVEKVAFFKKHISRGETVRMLFAVGSSHGGENEIAFAADVLDIVSSQDDLRPPEDNAFPSAFINKTARIWVKIRNITEQNLPSVSDLVVKSTGSLLRDVISNSQFHFGYVIDRKR